MSTRTDLADFHTTVHELPDWAQPMRPAASGSGEAWERTEFARHLGEQYQIVRELGRGGMGIVFLARDIALHRLVAIKVLRHEFAGSDEHRERFRREARMTAQLSHPNIVPVHTFGESGAFVYIVMKYVYGESLGERLRRERRIAVEDTRRILHELALALDYAHREGVVHRDLKAENILIERSSGRPMLTDFGVALQRSLDPVRADAARAFGTPHYMSPEQAAGELDIDGRSDLYSLGVLGYYMLSGRLPFDGASFEALAARHIAEQHAPLAGQAPDVLRQHPLLVAALERCLNKQREDRWRCGAELAEVIATPGRRRWLRAGASSIARASRWPFSAPVLAQLAMLLTALRAVLSRSV